MTISASNNENFVRLVWKSIVYSMVSPVEIDQWLYYANQFLLLNFDGFPIDDGKMIIVDNEDLFEIIEKDICYFSKTFIWLYEDNQEL